MEYVIISMLVVIIILLIILLTKVNRNKEEDVSLRKVEGGN